MKRFVFILLFLFSCAALAADTASQSGYQWVPGKLVPNEFALPDGTWSNATVRECVSRCTAQKACSGFSVEKKFGDAWQGGCQGSLCEQKTECHAKGSFGTSAMWSPADAIIHVTKVDAKSNAWIANWGTVIKR
ncbi:MAG: hypothetical protein WCN85_01905 [Burkholderiales bacterium]